MLNFVMNYIWTGCCCGVVQDKVQEVVLVSLLITSVAAGRVNFVVNYTEWDYTVNFVVNEPV